MNLNVQQTDRRAEVLIGIRHAIGGALASMAPALKELAQVKVPKRTGRLLHSIGTKVDAEKAELTLFSGGPGARHAHLTEYGTVKMGPRSYMRASVEELRPQMDRTVKTALGRPV